MPPVTLEQALANLRSGLQAAYSQQTIGLAEFVEHTVNFKLHDWQKNHLCPILERCLTERGLRLAIHGPPQFGKSVITSQRLPAWILGRDPKHRVGLACYNETHSTGFGAVVKDLMLSETYRSMFPSSSVRADAPAGRFSTSARAAERDAQPSFLAMGLLSGFTGKGVDTLIVDDPYKSADEAYSPTVNEKVWRWWTQTAGVRIAEEANVVVMFHRYHDDDFAGRLLASGFEYVRFPAIADENLDLSDPTGRDPGELLSPMRSLEWLKEQQERDPQTYLGQFQGKPRPDEGAYFRKDDFEIIEREPDMKCWVRGWDLATSTEQEGDDTAGAKVAQDDDGSPIIADIAAFKMEWPDAADEIILTARSDGPKTPVAIEKVGMQKALVQQLARDEFFELAESENEVTRKVEVERRRTAVLFGVPVKGDKKENAAAWARAGRRTKIKLVKGDWNEKFIEACIRFRGKDTDYDDPIDAVSRAWNLLMRLPKGRKLPDEHIPKDPFGASWAAERKRRNQTGSRRIFD